MTLDRCYLLGSFSCYYRQKRNAEKKATSKCTVVFLWKYILLVEFALTSQNYSKDSSYKIFWVQKITIPLKPKIAVRGFPVCICFVLVSGGLAELDVPSNLCCRLLGTLRLCQPKLNVFCLFFVTRRWQIEFYVDSPRAAQEYYASKKSSSLESKI